jgi:hypothetical protein
MRHNTFEKPKDKTPHPSILSPKAVSHAVQSPKKRRIDGLCLSVCRKAGSRAVLGVARLADGEGHVAVLDHVLDLLPHWAVCQYCAPSQSQGC